MDKLRILEDIKRLAASNGGKPLGLGRFEKESGIRTADWYPHHWLRWGDALKEAGLTPNKFTAKMDRAVVLDKYLALVRELGRVPIGGELRLKAETDSEFPSHGVFDGFGGKEALLAAVRKHCELNSAYADLLPLFSPTHASIVPDSAASQKLRNVAAGYVYLMKSGVASQKLVEIEHRRDPVR